MKFLFLTLSILSLSGCATAPQAAYRPTRAEAFQAVGGIYHDVKAGETLWRISKLYDVDIKTLVKANSMQDAAMLTKGERIFIPGVYKKKEDFKYSTAGDSFAWPVTGSVISYFGMKIDKVRNKGIDIGAGMGSDVRASRAGKVVFCDEALKGFGKTVIIDHKDNYQTVYAYNSELLVGVGDTVEQNQGIARAGRTGRAKEASLHFEIRKSGEPQNPFYYLPQR